MTTIIGIVAKKGIEGVVLGSDLSQTSVTWHPMGDVAVREQTRSDVQKIYVSQDNNFAVAGAGVVDDAYKQFLHQMISGKIDLKSRLESGRFEEFVGLHFNRFDGKIWNPEMTNALLVASRHSVKTETEKEDTLPRLYTCFQLGKIEERFYTAIGSGSKHANEFLDKQNLSVPEAISLTEAVELVKGSLDAGARDLFSSGYDIVVVTQDKIRAYGDAIKKEIKKAVGTSFEKIKNDIGQNQTK